MVVTFPRTVPDELGFASVEFRLQAMQELSTLRGGGQVAKDLGPRLWRLVASAPPVREGPLGVIRGWLDTLSSLEPFYAFDPLRIYPLAYKNGWGSLTVGGSPFDGTCTLANVESNNVEIDLSALPAGFIFSPGDYLAFDYGTDSRALHRIVAPATADGSGAVTVEVRPNVRVGWAASATVYLHKAACKMFIVPESTSDPVDVAHHGRVSFEAIQTL